MSLLAHLISYQSRIHRSLDFSDLIFAQFEADLHPVFYFYTLTILVHIHTRSIRWNVVLASDFTTRKNIS